MPAAAGAVAAAAVADQMLGPKEDRHLAIVLVFSIITDWFWLFIILMMLLYWQFNVIGIQTLKSFLKEGLILEATSSNSRLIPFVAPKNSFTNFVKNEWL